MTTPPLCSTCGDTGAVNYRTECCGCYHPRCCGRAMDGCGGLGCWGPERECCGQPLEYLDPCPNCSVGVLGSDYTTGSPERTPLCPYCHEPSGFMESSKPIYGRDYGPMYRCDECDAHVGCHPGGFTPLGRLANPELRRAKQQAHREFDHVWKRRLVQRLPMYGQRGRTYTRQMARGGRYKRLAELLGIPKESCHIGNFDLSTCRHVVELCRSDALEH